MNERARGGKRMNAGAGVVLGMAVVLAGSPFALAQAAESKGPAAAEKQVRDRVTAYWKTRMTLNLHEYYAYYEPAFRAKYTPNTFARDFRRLNRFAPEFLGIESIAFDPSGKKATVKVKLRTRPDVLGGKEFEAAVDESWLLQDGTWWRAAEALLPEF
jgi:hypothetical protein